MHCSTELHPWCMGLGAAEWLACSNDPSSYASRSLMLLAGPTKLDRSFGEGPDEAGISVLQARGFCTGSITRNCKTLSCYGNSYEDINYKCVRWPSSIFRDLHEWRW